MCAAVAPLTERREGASVEAAPADALPTLGQCWAGLFEIDGLLEANAPAGPGWRGRRLDTGERVELRVFPAGGDPLRADAWARLREIDFPQIVRALDRIPVGDQAVEVSAATPGETLRAWRAKQPTVDVPLIEAFVAQTAEALGALHAHGLVHLDLRPDTIYVQEEAAGPCFVVGGLSRVALSDRVERLALAADPFYAPPEAATLVEHRPGAGLCAWDWWTFGRVTQELFLGRHIFSQRLNCQPPQATAEARQRAEEFLLERDGDKGVRAGAVELMAPLDPRIDVLLRGLLASAVDARWGSEFVDRWLRKMPVKENYTAPRADAFFRWRGRPYSPEQAAAAMRTAAEWGGAIPQIWAADEWGTLAHFLKHAQSEALSKAHTRLTDLLALATSPALKPWPGDVVREALTAVALLQLAGPPFLWRGQRLGEECDPERVTLLRVLTTRSILLEIERCDPDTARWLTEISRSVAEAEALVRRVAKPTAADGDVVGAFFGSVLQPIAALQAARDELRRSYPCATLPNVQRLLTSDKPSRAELMAVAWMAREPRRYSFITAVEAQQREAEKWRARATAVATPWFWARLERALAAGPLVFGGLAILIGAWALVAAGAVILWPGIAGVLLALALGAALAGTRAAAAAVIAASVHRFVPAARAWRWREGAERCRAEITTSPESGDARSFAAAHAEANAELAKLTLLDPRPQPLAGPPAFFGLRVLGFGSWLVLVAALAALGWRWKVQPPSVEHHRVAWGLPEPGALDPDEPVRISWPYKAAETPVLVPVLRVAEASKEQLKQMLELGQAKVAPYRPETVATPIAFNVPDTEGTVVMVFDGRRGALVNQKLYVLSYRPLARTWIEVAEFKAIYLPD